MESEPIPPVDQLAETIPIVVNGRAAAVPMGDVTFAQVAAIAGTTAAAVATYADASGHYGAMSRGGKIAGEAGLIFWITEALPCPRD